MNRWWAVVGTGVALGLIFGWSALWGASERPIVVGILHSQSGPMAVSERAVIEATTLALEEIAQDGGLLGRPLRWVVADGASSEETFAREARRLIEEEGVAALFGCWTSASRKAVRAVVEEHDHLLMYPVQYEGCEESPNIVYLGAAPNQQIVPAVAWSLENLGRSFYVVGSDYVFPRVAGEIIRDQVEALGGTVVGESYLALGTRDVQATIDEILQAQPDVILNAINGDTNIAFFRVLARATAGGRTIPTISFSIAENELKTLGDLSTLEGHYAAWNYFQTVERPENRSFVRAFQARFGRGRVVSDPMEAAYVGVKLWAQAVAEAGSEDVGEVRMTLRRQSYDAPEGIVSIDGETQHLWKTVRIGRIRADGQFDIVWSSGRPVRPVPYPITESRSSWDALLSRLYEGWGRRWSNSGQEVQNEPPGPEAAPTIDVEEAVETPRKSQAGT